MDKRFNLLQNQMRPGGKTFRLTESEVARCVDREIRVRSDMQVFLDEFRLF